MNQNISNTKRDPVLGLSTSESAAINKSLSWYAVFDQEGASDVITEVEDRKKRLSEFETDFNTHRQFYENIGVHSVKDLIALRT